MEGRESLPDDTETVESRAARLAEAATKPVPRQHRRSIVILEERAKEAPLEERVVSLKSKGLKASIRRKSKKARDSIKSMVEGAGPSSEERASLQVASPEAPQQDDTRGGDESEATAESSVPPSDDDALDSEDDVPSDDKYDTAEEEPSTSAPVVPSAAAETAAENEPTSAPEQAPEAPARVSVTGNAMLGVATAEEEAAANVTQPAALAFGATARLSVTENPAMASLAAAEEPRASAPAPQGRQSYVGIEMGPIDPDRRKSRFSDVHLTPRNSEAVAQSQASLAAAYLASHTQPATVAESVPMSTYIDIRGGDIRRESNYAAQRAPKGEFELSADGKKEPSGRMATLWADVRFRAAVAVFVLLACAGIAIGVSSLYWTSAPAVPESSWVNQFVTPSGQLALSPGVFGPKYGYGISYTLTQLFATNGSYVMVNDVKVSPMSYYQATVTGNAQVFRSSVPVTLSFLENKDGLYYFAMSGVLPQAAFDFGNFPQLSGAPLNITCDGASFLFVSDMLDYNVGSLTVAGTFTSTANSSTPQQQAINALFGPFGAQGVVPFAATVNVGSVVVVPDPSVSTMAITPAFAFSNVQLVLTPSSNASAFIATMAIAASSTSSELTNSFAYTQQYPYAVSGFLYPSGQLAASGPLAGASPVVIGNGTFTATSGFVHFSWTYMGGFSGLANATFVSTASADSGSHSRRSTAAARGSLTVDLSQRRMVDEDLSSCPRADMVMTAATLSDIALALGILDDISANVPAIYAGRLADLLASNLTTTFAGSAHSLCGTLDLFGHISSAVLGDASLSIRQAPKVSASSLLSVLKNIPGPVVQLAPGVTVPLNQAVSLAVSALNSRNMLANFGFGVSGMRLAAPLDVTGALQGVVHDALHSDLDYTWAYAQYGGRDFSFISLVSSMIDATLASPVVSDATLNDVANIETWISVTPASTLDVSHYFHLGEFANELVAGPPAVTVSTRYMVASSEATSITPALRWDNVLDAATLALNATWTLSVPVVVKASVPFANLLTAVSACALPTLVGSSLDVVLGDTLKFGDLVYLMAGNLQPQPAVAVSGLPISCYNASQHLFSAAYGVEYVTGRTPILPVSNVWANVSSILRGSRLAKLLGSGSFQVPLSAGVSAPLQVCLQQLASTLDSLPNFIRRFVLHVPFGEPLVLSAVVKDIATALGGSGKHVIALDGVVVSLSAITDDILKSLAGASSRADAPSFLSAGDIAFDLAWTNVVSGIAVAAWGSAAVQWPLVTLAPEMATVPTSTVPLMESVLAVLRGATPLAAAPAPASLAVSGKTFKIVDAVEAALVAAAGMSFDMPLATLYIAGFGDVAVNLADALVPLVASMPSLTAKLVNSDLVTLSVGFGAVFPATLALAPQLKAFEGSVPASTNGVFVGRVVCGLQGNTTDVGGLLSFAPVTLADGSTISGVYFVATQSGITPTPALASLASLPVYIQASMGLATVDFDWRHLVVGGVASPSGLVTLTSATGAVWELTVAESTALILAPFGISATLDPSTMALTGSLSLGMVLQGQSRVATELALPVTASYDGCVALTPAPFPNTNSTSFNVTLTANAIVNSAVPTASVPISRLLIPDLMLSQFYGTAASFSPKCAASAFSAILSNSMFGNASALIQTFFSPSWPAILNNAARVLSARANPLSASLVQGLQCSGQLSLDVAGAVNAMNLSMGANAAQAARDLPLLSFNASTARQPLVVVLESLADAGSASSTVSSFPVCFGPNNTLCCNLGDVASAVVAAVPKSAAALAVPVLAGSLQYYYFLVPGNGWTLAAFPNTPSFYSGFQLRSPLLIASSAVVVANLTDLGPVAPRPSALLYTGLNFLSGMKDSNFAELQNLGKFSAFGANGFPSELPSPRARRALYGDVYGMGGASHYGVARRDIGDSFDSALDWMENFELYISSLVSEAESEFAALQGSPAFHNGTSGESVDLPPMYLGSTAMMTNITAMVGSELPFFSASALLSMFHANSVVNTTNGPVVVNGEQPVVVFQIVGNYTKTSISFVGQTAPGTTVPLGTDSNNQTVAYLSNTGVGLYYAPVNAGKEFDPSNPNSWDPMQQPVSPSANLTVTMFADFVFPQQGLSLPVQGTFNFATKCLQVSTGLDFNPANFSLFDLVDAISPGAADDAPQFVQEYILGWALEDVEFHADVIGCPQTAFSVSATISNEFVGGDGIVLGARFANAPAAYGDVLTTTLAAVQSKGCNDLDVSVNVGTLDVPFWQAVQYLVNASLSEFNLIILPMNLTAINCTAGNRTECNNPAAPPPAPIEGSTSSVTVALGYVVEQLISGLQYVYPTNPPTVWISSCSTTSPGSANPTLLDLAKAIMACEMCGASLGTTTMTQALTLWQYAIVISPSGNWGGVGQMGMPDEINSIRLDDVTLIYSSTYQTINPNNISRNAVFDNLDTYKGFNMFGQLDLGSTPQGQTVADMATLASIQLFAYVGYVGVGPQRQLMFVGMADIANPIQLNPTTILSKAYMRIENVSPYFNFFGTLTFTLNQDNWWAVSVNGIVTSNSVLIQGYLQRSSNSTDPSDWYTDPSGTLTSFPTGFDKEIAIMGAGLGLNYSTSVVNGEKVPYIDVRANVSIMVGEALLTLVGDAGGSQYNFSVSFTATVTDIDTPTGSGWSVADIIEMMFGDLSEFHTMPLSQVLGFLNGIDIVELSLMFTYSSQGIELGARLQISFEGVLFYLMALAQDYKPPASGGKTLNVAGWYFTFVVQFQQLTTSSKVLDALSAAFYTGAGAPSGKRDVGFYDATAGSGSSSSSGSGPLGFIMNPQANPLILLTSYTDPSILSTLSFLGPAVTSIASVMKNGVNIAATIPLTGDGPLGTVGALTHVNDVFVSLSVPPTIFPISIQVALGFNNVSVIPDFLYLEEGGLFIIIPKDMATTEFGIQGQVEVMLGSQQFMLAGSLGVSAVMVEGAISLLAPGITDPFGLNGIQIVDAGIDVGLGIEEEFFPVKFEMAGQLDMTPPKPFPAEEYSFMVNLNLVNPLQSAFLFDAVNLNLEGIVATFYPPVTEVWPSWLALTATRFEVEVNPGAAFVFNGVSYPQGLYVNVTDLTFAFIKDLNVLVEINKQMVEFQASVDPIEFAIFSLEGYDGSPGGPMVSLVLPLTMSQMSHFSFLLEGSVTFFDQSMQAYVSLNESGIVLAMNVEFFIFSLDLWCEALAGGSVAPVDTTNPADITDFAFYADLNITIIEWMEQQLPALLDQARITAVSALQSAQATVQSWESAVGAITYEINQRQQELEDEIQATLNSAMSAVAEAQSKVQGLLGQINNAEAEYHKHDNFWGWLDGTAEYYGIEIGVLYAAYYIAEGVLDLAMDFLKAMSSAASVLVDLDPELLALRFARGVLQGFLDLANVALEAAEGVVNGVMYLIEKAIEGILEIFSINWVKIWGSFAQIKQGNLATVQVDCVLLGLHLTLTLNLDFLNPWAMLQELAQSIINSIQEDFS